ncbi:MAG: hypothetical protein JO171_10285 [Paludibacterium sp.]|uniref:hypothetical protein n=1 Tax=Paludibacterium sp. TaxID=1917523 RepID=UPI0025F4CF4B|nr:hypothetical protein [Paludibacterium sp.]MBV8047534.1 hypothetical protein [Paludibacterium sp.]MBV8649603.1 hypothetical protein [Paludibacterium sp.]
MAVTANPLQLAFRSVPFAWPQGGWLPASALADPLALASALEAAQASLRDLHAEASVMRREMAREADASRAALLAQAHAECDAIRQQAHHEAVAAAVEWTVQEAELERALARSLMQRWRPLLARVLRALLGESDLAAVLQGRLERQVLELLPAGRVRLWVPASQRPSVTALFAHLPAVSVEADAALTEGQAILDNGLVKVWLDWPDYRDRLLRQLSEEQGSREETTHV